MRVVLLVLTVLFLVQCGNHKLVSEAKRETDKMHWDRSYQLWEQIYQINPNNTRAKIQMERSAMHASIRHLEEGLLLLAHRSFEEARAELLFALKYDPDNQSAIDGMERLEREQKEEKEAILRAKREEGDMPRTQTYSSYPQLKPSTWEPLNLYFPKPVKIRHIYQSLGRNYGINILVDGKVRGEIPYLDLRNMSFIKALDTLMVLNRHFFKVIDEHTLVIMMDIKKNREQYDNQIIKTYYLSNASPKDMVKHLKVLGNMKNYSENTDLNAITIKGTIEQIAIADRIIAANDKAQAEVIVEIELLEVNKNALRDMGIKPVFFDPSNPTQTTAMYQAGLYFKPDGGDASQIQGVFPHISSVDFLTVLPSVMLKLLKENSDSKQISNPHVRVTAGKVAKIQIGQSIPVPQTAFYNPYQSSNNSGTSSIGDQALTTFGYQNAGIDMSVTPRVHHNNEITLEFSLSVTSVVGQQGLQPIFGQRIIETTIRLKNGESSVLAGLLSNDERKSMTGFPGISDIPILGKLFSSEEKVVNQTDIILLLKPVIIRGANITQEDRAPYEISSLSLSSLYPEPKNTGSSPDRETMSPMGSTADAVSIKQHQNQQQTETRASHGERVRETSIQEDPPYDDENETAGYEESQSPAVLAFMPGVSEIRVDEPTKVQLFMTNVQGMYSGEIAVSFDPEFLQIEKILLQRLPVEEGLSPTLTPFWDQESGRATVIITPGRGATEFHGSGILANLMFRGLKPGTSPITVSQVECQNAAGQALTFQPLAGEIKVTP